MSIREKVYELLEAVESSAEIIDTNATSWESRKLDRENGEFTPDEITDPENLDRNRIDHELPLNISTHDRNSENGDVIDGATIVIGVEQEGEACDRAPENQEEEPHHTFHNYIYGESSFLSEVSKLLKESESDVSGIKQFNTDPRIAAYQVKNALNKLLPETASTGLQVIENTYGNRGEEKMFTVTGYGDVELPKELDVEVDAGNMTTLFLGKRDAEEPKAHHYFISEPENK